MGTEPAEVRLRRGKDYDIDDGVRDDGLDDYVINNGADDDGFRDDGLDGEGELRYEMLWAWNRRKLEYAGEWVAALELWRTLVRVAFVKGR
jgi:hypothetical protein